MIFVEKAALKDDIAREVVDIEKAESFRIETYKKGGETLHRVSVYLPGQSFERLADGLTREKADAVLNGLISKVQDQESYVKMSELIAAAE